MESISNLLPKANNEYMQMLYDIDEDVCEEYKAIAKFAAEKIEEIDKQDEADTRVDFYIPQELLAKTMYSEIHIYCYRKYSDGRYTSNYLFIKDEEGISLSIDLYRRNKWIEYCDFEEFVIDELMNVERDYAWYKEGRLEERLEFMRNFCQEIRQ